MSIAKQAKDQVIRLMLGKNSVPRGLVELLQYFRSYGPINFNIEKLEEGGFIAVSKEFKYGSIITTAPTELELDEKVKDAILTAFEIPSSYAKEAAISRHSEQKGYAFA